MEVRTICPSGHESSEIKLSRTSEILVSVDPEIRYDPSTVGQRRYLYHAQKDL